MVVGSGAHKETFRRKVLLACQGDLSAIQQQLSRQQLYTSEYWRTDCMSMKPSSEEGGWWWRLGWGDGVSGGWGAAGDMMVMVEALRVWWCWM